MLLEYYFVLQIINISRIWISFRLKVECCIIARLILNVHQLTKHCQIINTIYWIEQSRKHAIDTAVRFNVYCCIKYSQKALCFVYEIMDTVPHIPKCWAFTLSLPLAGMQLINPFQKKANTINIMEQQFLIIW